jgi:hypothetical protein
MRVSQTVKDYIEKQVWARYSKTENEIKAEEIDEIVEKVNQEIVELIRKSSQEIFDSVIAKYNLTEEMGGQEGRHCYKFSTWNSPLIQKAHADRRNRRQMVNQKIEDIIVTLELGGTKADLEKMLSEI